MIVRSVKFVMVCVLLAAPMAHAQRGTGVPPPPPPPGQHGGGPGGPPNAGGPGGGNGTNGSNGNPTPRSQVSTGTHSNGLQFGPPGRWWDDSSVRRSIGLTTGQQKKMDTIFDANKSAIVSSYQTLQTQQTKLDAMNKQANVDSKALFSQIDVVNQARAQLQKATSEMLLQLRGQMDAGQIVKLQDLQ